MEIIKKAHNFHRYTFDDTKTVYEKEFFLTSDWHFDNPKANRKLLFEHLEEAKKRNAFIIINGDLLCLMQGQYDPRKNKSAILPEHNGDNYLDLVINDTANKLLPYAKNILQINNGNHESGVSKRTETDVLMRLIERINTLADTTIQLGGYMGYINLSFEYKSNSRRVINIAYDHGHWGGIITKGALSVSRHASIFPNADVVISGHTHDGWIMTHNRYIMNQHKDCVEVKKQWHIKTGTYKEEFEKGSGWAVEKIGMPKHIGSCWMKVFYNNKKDIELEFTLTR
jgi:predicted phosphodiesterase